MNDQKSTDSPAVESEQAVETEESRFDAMRRRVGLVLGPAVFLLVLAMPFEQLTPEAHR